MPDPLRSIVEPPEARRLHRVLLAGALATSAVGAGLAMWFVRAPGEVPVPITLQPIVMMIEPAPTPPTPPAPAADPLGCPALAPVDDGDVGSKVRVEDFTFDGSSELPHEVVTTGQRIAYQVGYEVRLSDNDGATFRRVFHGREVEQLAIDRGGVVFARAGRAVGILGVDGRERWRPLPVTGCEDPEACGHRIATLGDELVAMYDDRIETSRDRGRTWSAVSTAQQTWAFGNGELLAWRGSLYQLQHHQDRCGIDDWFVWKLSPQHRISHEVFPEYLTGGGMSLRPSDHAAMTWSWRERCPGDDLSRFVACEDHEADRSAMLRAKTLFPVEGARTLAIYKGALVELCGNSARQVQRHFPFPALHAVDARGRPLVAYDSALYRWSATHGWRRLHRVP